MEIIKNGGGKRGVDTDILLSLLSPSTLLVIYREYFVQCVLYTRVLRARRSQTV